MRFGLVIEANALTNELKHKIWGDFNSYLHQGKLQLLDHPDQLNELAKMEKKLTSFGNIQYFGVRDDLAMVLALCVYKTLQYGEQRPAKPKAETSLSTDVRLRVQKRAKVGGGESGLWWNA